jgi:hypothetical protein
VPLSHLIILVILHIFTSLALAAPDAGNSLAPRTGVQQSAPGESAADPSINMEALKGAKQLKHALNRDTPPLREQPYTGLIKLFLFLIMTIGATVVARALLWGYRFLSMSGLSKMRLKRFNSLSPMVVRSLESMASSLWGENHLWSRKYHIVKKRDRWLLLDRTSTNVFRTTPEKNCVEISLRDTNLKIKLLLINGIRVNMTLECRDCSETALVKSLEEIAASLRSGQPLQRNRNDAKS